MIKRVYFAVLIFIWSLPLQVKKDNFKSKAHILLVSNPEYIKLARICTHSFLFHHKNSEVILHCDEAVFDETKKAFKKSFKRQKIQILCDQKTDSWQLCKIKLILSIAGTREAYMDADLKWNNGITRYKSLTFFVEEFDIRKEDSLKPLLRLPNFSQCKFPMMRNTSFVCFEGITVSKELSEKVIHLVKYFTETIKNLGFELVQEKNIVRLSEQISLSLFSEFISNEIFFLKDTDQRLDGGLVESAYYGSTGLGF